MNNAIAVANLPSPHFYSKQQEILYRGFTVTVFPDVFVPRQISKVQGASPKNKRMYGGKDVLDMGTGPGIQSIIAYAAEARSILAVDINPKACDNCKLNFQKLNITAAEVRCSDLFENVVEEFDSIVAYLPSINAEPQNMRERAIYDYDFQTFRRFLRDAKQHLRPEGAIHTCWVNIHDSISVFYEEVHKNHYRISESNCRVHEGEEWWMFDLIN